MSHRLFGSGVLRSGLTTRSVFFFFFLFFSLDEKKPCEKNFEENAPQRAIPPNSDRPTFPGTGWFMRAFERLARGLRQPSAFDKSTAMEAPGVCSNHRGC